MYDYECMWCLWTALKMYIAIGDLLVEAKFNEKLHGHSCMAVKVE